MFKCVFTIGNSRNNDIPEEDIVREIFCDDAENKLKKSCIKSIAKAFNVKENVVFCYEDDDQKSQLYTDFIININGYCYDDAEELTIMGIFKRIPVIKRFNLGFYDIESSEEENETNIFSEREPEPEPVPEIKKDKPEYNKPYTPPSKKGSIFSEEELKFYSDPKNFREIYSCYDKQYFLSSFRESFMNRIYMCKKGEKVKDVKARLVSMIDKWRVCIYAFIGSVAKPYYFLKENKNPLETSSSDNRNILKYRSNETFQILSEDGNEIVSIWEGTKTENGYDQNIDFHYTSNEFGSENKKHFNSFKGYGISYFPEAIDMNLVQPWLDHIEKVICNNNPAYFRRLMEILAYPIKTGKKSETAVVLYSELNGTGKGTLMKIMSLIYGPLYYYTKNSQILTKQFNAHLEGVHFLVVDETVNEKGRKDKNVEQSALKSCTDSATLEIEPKGKDMRTVQNNLNIFNTTNNKNSMKVDQNDRRLFCLWVSEKYGHIEFDDDNSEEAINHQNMRSEYHKMINSFVTVEAASHLFVYFKNYEMDVGGFITSPNPKTVLKDTMKEMSMTNIQLFKKQYFTPSGNGCFYSADSDNVQVFYDKNNKVESVNICKDHFCAVYERETGIKVSKLKFMTSLKSEGIKVEDRRLTFNGFRKTCYKFDNTINIDK